MPPRLLSLPPEIRTQIFSYLLVSPSNHVTTLPPGPWTFSIMPWDMRQEITLQSHTGAHKLDLSLLRVSKALNRECKELLWWRNTFVYNPFDVYRHTERAVGKGLGPLAGARRVAMDVDMTAARSLDAVVVGLEALAYWSKSASLEEATLIVVNERRKPFQERDPTVEKTLAYKASLEKLIRSRTGNPKTHLRGVQAVEMAQQEQRCFQEYLSAFRDARSGCLAAVNRKIIVNTNFGKLSFQEQSKYLKAAFMDPNALMMELNEAFGGELWIDGRLCFSKGEQLRNAFQVSIDEELSEALEAQRVDLVIADHDEGISTQPKLTNTSNHELRDRAPWGQLVEVRASVLDLVE